MYSKDSSTKITSHSAARQNYQRHSLILKGYHIHLVNCKPVLKLRLYSLELGLYAAKLQGKADCRLYVKSTTSVIHLSELI